MTSTAPTAARALLLSLFDEAVSAASAERCLPPAMRVEPVTGRTLIIAVGKAAAAMASRNPKR